MKMMRYMVLLSAFAGTMQAAPLIVEELKPKMEAMAAATGSDYIAQRDAVVALSSNALPALLQCQSSNESWQIQIVAGICRERIEHSDAVKAMITKDWRKDSGWNKDWDLVTPNVPSYRHCKELMVRRYREAGLWYYYIELFWKSTGEIPDIGPDMRSSYWSDLSLTASKESPVIGLVASIMEKNIIESGVIDQSTLEFFVHNKLHSGLATFLAVWEKGKAENMPLHLYGMILSLAGTNDLQHLEEFASQNPRLSHVDFVQQRIQELKAKK